MIQPVLLIYLIAAGEVCFSLTLTCFSLNVLLASLDNQVRTNEFATRKKVIQSATILSYM